MGVLVWYKKEEKVKEQDEGLKNEEMLNLTLIFIFIIGQHTVKSWSSFDAS
jgi:hypothetical protein